MIDEKEAHRLLDVALTHHGVKGQKWGVRKERDGTASGVEKDKRLTPRQKEIAKKVAIGTAILVAIAGAAYLGTKLKEDGSLSIPEIKNSPVAEKGKQAIVKKAEEQTDIVYASRGKNRGFTFLKKGGLSDPFDEYTKAFGQDHFEDGLFERMDGGRIATSFLDPEGKRDRATRPITHQIIIPKSMTDGVNNIDDVKTKIWPQLKEQHTDYYNLPPNNF